MSKDGKKIKLNAVASPLEMGAWAVVLLIVLFFGAKRFFTPLSEKVETTKSQVLAKQMELESFKKFLKGNSANNRKSIEGMDLNRQTMAQKVKDAFSKINMAPDVVMSELLSAMTNATYAKSALLEKFTLSGEKKQSGYVEMGIDLKLNGTYNGIGEYLGYIKQLPYLLRIETVSISNKEKDPQKQQGSQVELTAHTILYVGEPKALENIVQGPSKTDMATDLLIEMTGGKSNSPFSARPREMSNWSLNELKLTSTMAGGTRPTALINNKVFTLGDEIADFKIVEIRPNEVVLERGDVKHILSIHQENTPEAEQGFIQKQTDPTHPNTAPTSAPAPSNSETPPEQAAPSEEQGGGSEKAPDENTHDKHANPENSNSAPEKPGAGNNPGGYSDKDWDTYTSNKSGVLGTGTVQEPTGNTGNTGNEPIAQNPEPDPGDKKDKLDPNKVEDLEEVPFEDLMDPGPNPEEV